MDLQENTTATKRKAGVSNSYAYDSHWLEFALTTYCQAKCRSCARTNEEKKLWKDESTKKTWKEKNLKL